MGADTPVTHTTYTVIQNHNCTHVGTFTHAVVFTQTHTDADTDRQTHTQTHIYKQARIYHQFINLAIIF